MDDTPKKIIDDLEWPARERQQDRPPEEYENPPGVGGDDCDIEDASPEPCDPTEIKDMVMEESMPGVGIEGYEGEEVGGG